MAKSGELIKWLAEREVIPKAQRLLRVRSFATEALLPLKQSPERSK